MPARPTSRAKLSGLDQRNHIPLSPLCQERRMARRSGRMKPSPRTRLSGLKPKRRPTSRTKSAQLNGSFVGNGEDTHYYFEWGTDPCYGHTTPLLRRRRISGGPGPTPLSFDSLWPQLPQHRIPLPSRRRKLGRDQPAAKTRNSPRCRPWPESPPKRRRASKPRAPQLNGSFVGNGEDTHYYFEWGTDPSYGHTTRRRRSGRRLQAARPDPGISEVTGLDAVHHLPLPSGREQCGRHQLWRRSKS